MIWHSVNARKSDSFVSAQNDLVQCNGEGKGTLLYRMKSDLVQCKCEGKGTLLYRVKSDSVQCKREGKGTFLYRIKSDSVQCKREGKGAFFYRIESDSVQCKRSRSSPVACRVLFQLDRYPELSVRLNLKNFLISSGRSQVGTIRTNCVDCLDRTNAVQTKFAQTVCQSFIDRLIDSFNDNVIIYFLVVMINFFIDLAIDRLIQQIE